MPLFHIRFEFTCLQLWPALRKCSFVCRIMLLGFSPQVACFFDKRGQTFENQRAKHSVARFQIVKSY
jgi:hypothetical protein